MHAGHIVPPELFLRSWRVERAPLVATLGLAVVYARGVRVAARRRAMSAFRRQRAWYFAAASIVMLLALASPLDELAGSLFTAHMIQHELLVLAAAPLYVMSAPVAELLRALPGSITRGIVRAWRGSRSLRAAVRVLTQPTIALALHASALLAWHVGPLYERALWHAGWHAAEHACFLSTGMLFWWTVLQPVGHRRLSGGLTLLSLFAMTMITGALGAIITLANVAWYPGQELSATAWGMTALEDQQLAGLIMWIPGGLVYVGIAAWIGVRWLSVSGSLYEKANSQL